MNRRAFLALASGLLVPAPEPVRSYFFAPVGGWFGPLSFDPTLKAWGELMGMAPFEGEGEEAFRSRLRANWTRRHEELETELRDAVDRALEPIVRAHRRPRYRVRIDPTNPKRMLVDEVTE